MGKFKKVFISTILITLFFVINSLPVYADPAGTQNTSSYNSNVTVKNTYSSLIFTSCKNTKEGDALVCWMQSAWLWTQRGVLILSVAVIIFAGLLYMTSAGDPQRIGLAKKYILGALSGIAVVVLGRFFLTKVIGVPWPWL